MLGVERLLQRRDKGPGEERQLEVRSWKSPLLLVAHLKKESR